MHNYNKVSIKAKPHKARLNALYESCLLIFRDFAQKFLDRRQPACEISIQSDVKSDGASSAQSLCGVALIIKPSERNFGRFFLYFDKILDIEAYFLYIYNSLYFHPQSALKAETHKARGVLCILLP